MPQANRELPASVEAEESLLGALLTDESVIYDIIEIVSPDDFFSEINKKVYSAIHDLFSQGEPIEMVTVAEQLKADGNLDIIGGYEYLADLTAGNFLTSNAPKYAEIIAEKASLRGLIKAGQTITANAASGELSASDAMENAEKTIFDISQRKAGKSYSPIKDVLTNVYDELESSIGKSGITGIPSGFIDLDKKTSGLHDSDLIIIAARPGMGKTAFMLDIAQYVAVKKKLPVAVFDLEMSKEQVAKRILSSASGVSSEKIRSGDLQDSDWTALAEATGYLADAPLYIDDALDVSVTAIRAKCRKLKLEKDIKLIIIDYLQLMTSGSKRGEGNRVVEVSEISRELKMLAREIGVPVIVGSQLSRGVDSRDDKRPQLSDLRESGSIEQDADIVMFLYRDFYYNKENTEYQNVAELIMGKHRNGSLGTINLFFDGEHVSFKNMANH